MLYVEAVVDELCGEIIQEFGIARGVACPDIVDRFDVWPRLTMWRMYLLEKR